MNIDSQIFIQRDLNQEPIEYLLDTQPLNMIRGNHITKDDIKRANSGGAARAAG